MSDNKIIMVTGGTRSGKSLFAEQMALQMGASPTYLATATVRDDEFRDRVARHQARRGSEWTTVEEPLKLGSLSFTDQEVVLVDCLTLWCTNVFFEFNEDVDNSLAYMRSEFERLISQSVSFIIVTNEIGLGGVADNQLTRKFTDLQGWANQYVASRADEVYMLVSGIPMKIK